MTYNSLSTVERANIDTFLEQLRKFDPELYVIKIALIESGLNPNILPKIIRAISNVAIGTGYGKVQVIMQSTVITQILGEESSIVNEKATIT